MWSDRRRERLHWFKQHEDAVHESERLRARLVAKGWRFEAQLETANGWVIVESKPGGGTLGREDREAIDQ